MSHLASLPLMMSDTTITRTSEEVPIWAMLAGSLFILLIALAISAVVCLLLYLPYKEVPAEHRRMAPGAIWLLLIPLFNLVWNFVVFQRIPESFQSYFVSHGRTDVGDGGKALGLWYAITAAVGVIGSMIPLLGCLFVFVSLAALVLLIIFLVKIWGLKGQITSPATAPPPAV